MYSRKYDIMVLLIMLAEIFLVDVYGRSSQQPYDKSIFNMQIISLKPLTAAQRSGGIHFNYAHLP